MRRFALLGFASLLSACSFVGSPFENFGEFIGDTHNVYRNPNRPVGNSENMLRVTGREVNVPPLEPESGNVWPGPQAPEPTLQDIERQQNNASQGNAGIASPTAPVPNVPTGTPGLPRVVPQGSSTPPAAPSPRQVAPPPPGVQSYAPPPLQPGGPRSPTIDTPQGPVVTTPGGNGITTFAAPGGGTGIVVPNGNGTNTLVSPDGSVQTVPAPK